MKKLFLTAFISFTFLLCIVSFAETTLTHITHNTKKAGITSVHFHFSSTTPKYHHFFLKKPHPRFVLDLLDTQMSKNALTTQIHNDLIEDLRYGSLPDHKGVRIVFDLKKPMNALSTTFHPGRNQLALSFKSEQSVIRPAIVVIDPGHGGKDPGATGPQGYHEKNIVLNVGKYLRADLLKMQGIHPDMTRTGDYFVTLRGRLRVARKDHADVFVAIHADSFPRKSAHGATVFALSEHGATSEAARWLAHSENTAVLGGVAFQGQSKTVRSVLLDLSQAITIEDSLTLGSDVKDALSQVTSLHSNRVEQAPFVVLKSPDIPSILVETGFISNYKQEEELINSAHQQALAHALATGIREYLYQHPPHNSMIEKQQSGTLTYTVLKGASINQVAESFNVSVAALMKDNNIKTVKAGQVIKIPAAKV